MEECPEYASERAMVEQMVPALHDEFFPMQAESSVSLEVGAGRRIADVVIASSRSPRGLPKLSVQECVVLYQLRVFGATRVDLLEARSGVGRGDLRSAILPRLEALGVAIRGAGGRVAGSTGWQDLNVIAIEAKLRDWKRAAKQAARYLEYANQAYVALPDVLARRVARDSDRLPQITSLGVGLIAVSSGRIQRLAEGPSATRHNWRREFVISRLWGNL